MARATVACLPKPIVTALPSIATNRPISRNGAMLGKLWPTSSCNRSQSKVTACGGRVSVVCAPTERFDGSGEGGRLVLAAAPPGAGLGTGTAASDAVERDGTGPPVGREVGVFSDRTAAG